MLALAGLGVLAQPRLLGGAITQRRRVGRDPLDLAQRALNLFGHEIRQRIRDVEEERRQRVGPASVACGAPSGELNQLTHCGYPPGRSECRSLCSSRTSNEPSTGNWR